MQSCCINCLYIFESMNNSYILTIYCKLYVWEWCYAQLIPVAMHDSLLCMFSMGVQVKTLELFVGIIFAKKIFLSRILYIIMFREKSFVTHDFSLRGGACNRVKLR